mgnify:CR=1 FL=1
MISIYLSNHIDFLCVLHFPLYLQKGFCLVSLWWTLYGHWVVLQKFFFQYTLLTFMKNFYTDTLRSSFNLCLFYPFSFFLFIQFHTFILIVNISFQLFPIHFVSNFPLNWHFILSVISYLLWYKLSYELAIYTFSWFLVL